jgi:hypothetical protein
VKRQYVVVLAFGLAATAFAGAAALRRSAAIDMLPEPADPQARVEVLQPSGSPLSFDYSCGTQLYFSALQVAERWPDSHRDVIATIVSSPSDAGGVQMTVLHLGFRADALVPDLLPLLDHGDPEVRSTAGATLTTAFLSPCEH